MRLTEKTRGLINREGLSSIKLVVILINTDRDAVLNKNALVDILKTRRLWGAALDVYNEEPIYTDDPPIQIGEYDSHTS